MTARVEGEEVFHGRTPNPFHVLRRFLNHFQSDNIRVTYEAGPFGFYLYDTFIQDGIKAIVVYMKKCESYPCF